jgi:ATP-binding cassette, subfamily F, member 3
VIQLEGVSKVYGSRVLFRDLTWQLGGRERIGLVGPNGAGKTTLCRLLAGLEEPDLGRVVRPREATLGYLPQEVAGDPEGSVLGAALAGFADVWEVERQMEAALAGLREKQDAATTELLTARYGELQHRFEALGGYRLETEARVILGGLGWRMRAALARLLLLRPAFLLLDEPTNHLDLESLAWLEGYLEAYEGTVVVVSHDRYFLNRMVTGIAALEGGALTVYPGDYDLYLIQREARRALRLAAARNQAKRVAEIERFIERFRYKATKARQVQSRVKMLARLERLEADGPERQIRLAFPAPPRSGRHVVRLRDARKAYGDHVVYAALDLDVERGDRIALVGVNGAGKSTLLRMLAGVLPLDAGERLLGAHVSAHYYAQHQLDQLHADHTLLAELEEVAPDAERTRLRSLLGAFLFSGDDVEKTVAVLSGGEKARLALARMLIRPAPLLCLDEPTNHLDLASRAVLEDALGDFPGSMVFISHDRYFINLLATKVVEVAGGRLTVHPGNYDDYRAASRREMALDGAGPGPEPASAGGRDGQRTGASPPTAGAPAAAPGTRSRPITSRLQARRTRVDPALRPLRRRLEEVEGQIHVIEARLRELGDLLGDPRLYADGTRARTVTAERKSLEEQVAWLMQEWEELSAALATHD